MKSTTTTLMVFRKWLEHRYKCMAATRGPLRSWLRARYVEVSDHARIALAIPCDSTRARGQVSKGNYNYPLYGN